jgi:choline dehydrogenase-like flavoprotein
VARRALLRGVVSAQGQRWTGGTEWAGRPLRAGEPICPLTGYDWNYRTSKQLQLSDRELYLPRGKTLCGSSSINGQAGTRGHRVDWDGWAQICPGWSFDEVLPY